mgnify:CR=1 FL=1
MRPIFSKAELTGQARTHVVDLETLPCTLHREVAEPFLSMRHAAAADGIDLIPFSSFRDFDRQLAIWNAKARGERALLDAEGRQLDARTLDPAARVEAILCWSALPGASRHHWGTDFDVMDAAALPPGYRLQVVPEEYAPDGIFAKLTDWLDKHAARFGFYRPYTTWRGGVRPEPWHLSHAAVAAAAAAQFTPGLLEEVLAAADIEDGAALQPLLPALFERYVVNVDAPPAAALNASGATRPA